MIVVACKGTLLFFSNRQDSNHPAKLRSLIIAFSFRVYNLWILGTLNVKIEISDHIRGCAGWFELLWYAYGYTFSLVNDYNFINKRYINIFTGAVWYYFI